MQSTIDNYSPGHLADLFHGGEPIHAVAARMRISPRVLKRRWAQTFGDAALSARKTRLRSAAKLGTNNPHYSKTRDRNPAWKGGRSRHSNGYVLVLAPAWWTGSTSRAGADGYVLEHRVVMARKLGLTDIPRGLDIHHKDGGKTNNDPANLEMLTTAEHSRLHGRKGRADGNWTLQVE